MLRRIIQGKENKNAQQTIIAIAKIALNISNSFDS